MKSRKAIGAGIAIIAVIAVIAWQTLRPEATDQGDAQFIRHVEKMEHHFLTFFNGGRVTDELTCELGNTWILHAIRTMRSLVGINP